MSGDCGNVMGAGELIVNENGIISKINNRSGHYQSNLQDLLNATTFLEQKYDLYFGECEIIEHINKNQHCA